MVMSANLQELGREARAVDLFDGALGPCLLVLAEVDLGERPPPELAPNDVLINAGPVRPLASRRRRDHGGAPPRPRRRPRPRRGDVAEIHQPWSAEPS